MDNQLPPPVPKKSAQKSPLLWVVLALGLGFLAWRGNQILGAAGADAPPDFKTIAAEALANTSVFKSPDGDFQLKYPTSWDLDPKPSPPMKFRVSTKGVVD